MELGYQLCLFYPSHSYVPRKRKACLFSKAFLIWPDRFVANRWSWDRAQPPLSRLSPGPQAACHMVPLVQQLDQCINQDIGGQQKPLQVFPREKIIQGNGYSTDRGRSWENPEMSNNSGGFLGPVLGHLTTAGTCGAVQWAHDSKRRRMRRTIPQAGRQDIHSASLFHLPPHLSHVPKQAGCQLTWEPRELLSRTEQVGSKIRQAQNQSQILRLFHDTHKRRSVTNMWS